MKKLIILSLVLLFSGCSKINIQLPEQTVEGYVKSITTDEVLIGTNGIEHGVTKISFYKSFISAVFESNSDIVKYVQIDDYIKITPQTRNTQRFYIKKKNAKEYIFLIGEWGNIIQDLSPHIEEKTSKNKNITSSEQGSWR